MPLADIETIEHLKKNLNMGPGYGGYVELLHALKLPKSEWENYCNWKEDSYSRNCIASCEGYELLLMCWQKEQASPIHSYHFQEGWIKVLEGELTIETFEIDRDNKSYEIREKLIVKAGESTYLNDSMGFHKVLNSAKGKTVSMHLHVERLTKWEVFNPETQSFSIENPIYDQISSDCVD
jgi:hypothetical protein